MKYSRQNRIVKIVRERAVHTHDELIDLLREDGFSVTQSTVSRDIKELGLIKVPDPDGGYVYSVPGQAAETLAGRVSIAADSVIDVTAAMHTVVIHTYPGMAPAVGTAVDAVMRGRIIGSIAGDDTLLIIAKDPKKAEKLEKDLKILFEVKMTNA